MFLVFDEKTPFPQRDGLLKKMGIKEGLRIYLEFLADPQKYGEFDPGSG